MTRRRIAVGAGLAAAAVLAVAWGLRRGDPAQYFSARVERGDIRDVVDVTGTLNPVRTVQVGSQVSGTIARLYADFNSPVHVGEIIARIDPRLLQGARLQASADLESAKASLVAARANVARLQALLVQAKAAYERTATLASAEAVTQAELDLATSDYHSAAAALDAGRANVVQAAALVSQKDAAVMVARTNLAYTVIRSPINGVVVARNVDVGQTVAASLQAPTVFTIAQDLTRMQLYAKTDESDVGRISVGAPVTFQVDAFPADTFQGVVSQLRMDATTVQNVVTYDAIIDVGNPRRKLVPGMTAYVTIPVATARAVVKVPNSALRYRPPLTADDIRALYARAGIAIPDSTERARSSSAAAASSREPVGRSTGTAARTKSAVVWKLEHGDAVMPVEIGLGITDHAYTQVTGVLAGTLAPGDDVVTGSLTSAARAPGVRPPGR